MGRRTHQSSPKPVGEGLTRLVSSRSMAAGLALGRIQRAWAGAMGPAIAGAAAPVAFENGRLRVAARNSAWANELQAMSNLVLEKLNEALTGVKVVDLSVGVSKFVRAPGPEDD